jgi:tetratricopeptide (TPR) repeat protein
MSRIGIAVSLHRGAPQSTPARAIEVDAGVALPVAFGGLRKILQLLGEHAPAVVKRAAEQHPAVWNRLFPGAAQGAPDLSDLALSPSERRLHRESEQAFWILNMVARLILDAIEEAGRPLVIRNAGQCDLVSLRGLMRAIEWARIDGHPGQVLLFDWDSRRKHSAALFAGRHDAYITTLQERMRASPEQGRGGWRIEARALEAPVDLEGRYLQETVDEHQGAERRIAAAILAIRACFFTTNYEGAMLAAEHGLALLEQLGPALDTAAVVRAWDELEHTGFVTPAIEVDRSSIGGADELRALFHRQIGVVQVYTGQHDESLASFARGLECTLPPERQAQLRMFRALTMIKRLGNLDRARAEAEAGLKVLEGNGGPQSALHEAWLRNVYALICFQEKQLDQAMHQEKLAMKCVGDLHDPSATHLKINLISNLSVVQETRKQYADAIATWRRFEKISANWGVNFFKHHAYRLAALQLLAGERAAAVQGFGQAYASAEALGDPFHLQVIAAELGRVYLDAGERAEAETWFRRAAESARAIGDPLRLAESLAGISVAVGGTDWAEAKRLAGESTTYVAEAAKLSQALASGDPAAVQAVLPRPRTKLNRPFDLVNL